MEKFNDFYLVDEAAVSNATTTSSVEEFIPEVWSQRIREYRDDALVVTQLMEVDNTIQGPGDVLHIMKDVKTDLTPEAHTETTTVVTKELASEEVLLIPQTFAVRTLVSDQLVRRSIPNMVEQSARKLGVAHAEFIEDTIIGTLEGGYDEGDSEVEFQVIDNSAATLTADLIKEAFSEAKTKFMRLNYTADEKFCVMSPEDYELILNDDQFVDASVFGGREAVLNGEIARYKGIRVLISNRLRRTGHWSAANDSADEDDADMWFLVRDSCTVGYKQMPTIETDRIVERLSTQVVSSLDFGVVLVYEDRAIRHVFRPA